MALVQPIVLNSKAMEFDMTAGGCGAMRIEVR